MYVVLGVPYYWRSNNGMKAGFTANDLLCGDMIQPWSVGAFKSSQELEDKT